MYTQVYLGRVFLPRRHPCIVRLHALSPFGYLLPRGYANASCLGLETLPQHWTHHLLFENVFDERGLQKIRILSLRPAGFARIAPPCAGVGGACALRLGFWGLKTRPSPLNPPPP